MNPTKRSTLLLFAAMLPLLATPVRAQTPEAPLLNLEAKIVLGDRSELADQAFARAA